MPDESSAPKLVVEGGIHDAVAFTVGAETHVGNGLDNTVVLTDHEDAVGFLASREHDALILQAIGSPIAIDGRCVPKRQQIVCWADSTFENGGLSFRVVMPPRQPIAQAPPASGATVGTNVRYAVGVIGIAGAIVVGAPLMALSWTSAQRTAVHAGSAEGGTNYSPGELAQDKHISSELSESLMGELRSELVGHKIESVHIKADPDGAILATGHVTSSELPVWSALQRSFDTKAKGQVLLRNRVGTSDVTAPLQLRAAYPKGPRPYVIDSSDIKLFAGAQLKDGWIIRNIEDSRVVLERGDQIIALRFQ